MSFNLISDFSPTGDQPQAINEIVNSYNQNQNHVTLQGVTGSGKTFTVANVINELDRPTLVLSHNKTLAAQLFLNQMRNGREMRKLKFLNLMTMTKFILILVFQNL